MKPIVGILTSRKTIQAFVLDVFIVAFIFFIPTFSHLLSFPLYLADPMRIGLIIALTHSHKRNAYFIALTLPLFSYAISAHPVIYKALIISMELVINVWLFFILHKIIKESLPAIFLSIIISKAIYYFAKYLLISTALIESNLISTPIWVQLIVAIVLSAYIFAFYKQKES